MVEVVEGVISGYNGLVSMLPEFGQKFVMLFLLVVLITSYSVFIWKFYRFVAHKNIIGINLNRYNKNSSPFLTGILYFFEYIIILPFIIFFWFAIFTFFLILLNESLNVNQILIVSAVIVAAIRMTSYYSEDLSKDLAKYFPLMLLASFILNPQFFDVTRVIGQLRELFVFLQDVVIYLLFIIALEVVLRFFDLIFLWLGIGEPPVVEEEE